MSIELLPDLTPPAHQPTRACSPGACVINVSVANATQKEIDSEMNMRLGLFVI